MKTETITLKITYNENNYRNPSEWDWGAILDLSPEENVEIQEATNANA